MNKTLFKSHGVLWKVVAHPSSGVEFIADTPVCPDPSCRSTLSIKDKGYYCESCDKTTATNKSHKEVRNLVQKKWEGYMLQDYDVYSLDLPPTKIVSEDNEDENYWVQARISEKNGKRMAVVYFGEKIKGKQDKKDYTQLFIDFDDEQIRFDKSNKNPMNLLSKFTAEFQESITEMKRKDVGGS